MEKKYNPVAEAYQILVNALYCEQPFDLDALPAVVEEAIGYLGEALAD